MALLAIGYLWRPVPELFQGPVALSIPAALMGSPMLASIQHRRSWIIGVAMLALTLDSSILRRCLLLVLISMRLRQARFFYAYFWVIVATDMAYFAVKNLVNPESYFKVRIAVNVMDVVMFLTAELVFRGTKFLLP
jgi:hypothetical protein